MDLGKPQLNTIYSSLFVILKRCKVQKTDFQGFKLSLLLKWLKFAENQLLLVLGPMDASYMSILHTNNFHCVFRYYYDVNANTECPLCKLAIYFLLTEWMKTFEQRCQFLIETYSVLSFEYKTRTTMYSKC